MFFYEISYVKRLKERNSVQNTKEEIVFLFLNVSD